MTSEAAVVSITGILSIPSAVCDMYTGDYTVTPSVGRQVVQTAEKMLLQDIVVEAIPYAETSNNSGGFTATIG